MNIAVLTRACYPFHGLGGLERHVYDLVRHLIARDVRVTLVTPPDREQAQAGLKPCSTTERLQPSSTVDPACVLEDPRCVRRVVPYRTFPLAGRRGTTVIDRSTAYPLFGRRAGRLVADLVRRGEVHLVYGLGASALGYAHARAHGAAAPLVFNPQGLEEFGATDPRRGGGWLKRAGYAPLRAAVRACARAADCVIATDQVLEPVVRRHLRVPADRVRVIPNAIDLDACDRLATADAGNRVRAAHHIGSAETVLLSVGRLQANKGFHVLAEALSRLRDCARTNGGADGPAPPWRWVLVGDGPYRASIERAIDAGGLRDRALLPGRVSEADLHGWYEAATLFVHPTLYEGSSLVTLEAMAHRRAVVATTAGGLPDKVQPGVSGWLVPPDDADALAAAIREALGHPDRLAAMGLEGRKTAVARFSWPRVTEAFLELCTEVLDRSESSSLR
jgi:glycosyltransferase involved in cell wall biosynthesis